MAIFKGTNGEDIVVSSASNLKPIVLTVHASDKGIELGDNKGNHLKEANGYVNATCDGKVQDVNLVKLAALSAQLGSNVTLDALLHPTGGILISAESAASTPHTSAPAALASLANTIQHVDMTVTLKEGLPSPLANLCKAGQDNGIIRNHR